MTEWKDGIAKITLPTHYAVGDVNVYLIKGERLTLVDTGVKTEESWNSLTEQLADLNLKPSDIEQVVLTHHHPDHSAMLDFFPESMEVYGHPNNERWIHSNETFFQEQETFVLKLFHELGLPEEFLPFVSSLRKTQKYICHRPLTGELLEGMTPPGLSEWKVIETPGHAQSQIALFREKNGVVIGGDVLLAHISPNPILEPPLPGETERPKPLIQHNESIKKLLTYPIQFFYTGHGEDIYEWQALIEKRLARQHERAMTVLEWLKEEKLTTFEICKRLFPTVYKKELMLTVSETVGQLDYLLSIGEINGEGQRPIIYQATYKG